MKRLSVLILVAILGIALWALPVGAEKIRLTDAELDGITAGIPSFPCGQVCVQFNKTGGVAGAGINAIGGLGGDPHGTFSAGGAIPLAGGISANIFATGHDPAPMIGGSVEINFKVPGNQRSIDLINISVPKP